MTSVHRRTLALAAILALTACSGNASDPGAASPAAELASSGASDSGAGTDSASATSGPGVVVEGGPGSGAVPAVTPGGLDLTGMTTPCSYEGTISVPTSGASQPTIDHSPGTFAYTGWVADGDTYLAQFTLDTGSGPLPLTPARLGDTFELGGSSYTVSSICEDEAKLDRID
ncbi:MAG: hypothetical protein Q4G21_02810 [Dermabacter sp.]|nr:hypothetical protein [Dermabacter sp.]